MEQAGVPRSVAMKLAGHQTEAIYRRYAMVSPQDLKDDRPPAEWLQEQLQSGPVT